MLCYLMFVFVYYSLCGLYLVVLLFVLLCFVSFVWRSCVFGDVGSCMMYLSGMCCLHCCCQSVLYMFGWCRLVSVGCCCLFFEWCYLVLRIVDWYWWIPDGLELSWLKCVVVE